MTALDKAIDHLGLGWVERPARAARAAVTLASCLALVAAIALGDYLTGYDIRLAILYLVPIAFATWQLGPVAGMSTAVTAALCWVITFSSSHPYSHSFYFYWEGAITGTTYLIVVALLTWLRAALLRSDRRFMTVLEGLDAAVYVEAVGSGEILLANRRFRDLYGDAKPPRLVPGNADAVEVHDPVMQRWFLVQSRPLQWIDGRAVVLRLLSDITEGKRVSELVMRHRDAVHRSARLIALGEFASAVAHELSQPLAAIATYNNAALLLVQDAPELRDAMEKCRDQARRAGAIIQRLKELLRHPTPALVEHDLNEIAASARDLAESEAQEVGVKLDLAVTREVLPVGADRVLLQQAVLNLVRNGIESCRAGDRRWRRVAISTSRSADGAALLRVSDWGSGVAPDIEPRLFQPFVSGKPGGLGLGLSICRSVIEAHGGTIRHRPNDDRGSVFEFALPAKA